MRGNCTHGQYKRAQARVYRCLLDVLFKADVQFKSAIARMNSSMPIFIRSNAACVRTLWLGCGLLAVLSGCSSSDLLSLANIPTTQEAAMKTLNIAQPTADNAEQLGDDLSSPETLLTSTQVALPSPGRTNAFELGGDFREETNSNGTSGKREIKVSGFIELDQPTAILLIEGKAHTFHVGETLVGVTVSEIQPPRVRLSYDGVTWNASLFDR